MKFILTGMPGCGKTALGRNAAKHMHCRFCDLDAEIERTEGKSITEIFKNDGEDGFRRIETAALKKSLSAPDRGEPEIISSGGGIVVRPENLEIMSNAFVIFIDRPTECIKSDIDTSARPLLANDNDKLNRLFNERIPLYTKSCNVRILNNGSFSEALNKLISVIQSEISKSKTRRKSQ